MIDFEDYAKLLTESIFQVRPALTKAAEAIGELQKECVQKEIIGHELPMWDPLSEATVDGWEDFPGKRQLGYTGRVSETDPLLRTGKMRDSVDYSVRPTPVGVEVTLGSSDPVAIYQELGTSKIPARPFLATGTMATMDESEKILANVAVSLLTPKKR